MRPQLSAYIVALVAILFAASQYFQATEFRQALIVSGQQQQVMQTQIRQLEDNLQSAGEQMQQLSTMIQDANQRVAACVSASNR